LRAGVTGLAARDVLREVILVHGVHERLEVGATLRLVTEHALLGARVATAVRGQAAVTAVAGLVGDDLAQRERAGIWANGVRRATELARAAKRSRREHEHGLGPCRVEAGQRCG